MNLLTCPRRVFGEFRIEEKTRSQGEGNYPKKCAVSLLTLRCELSESCEWVWVHLEGAPAMLPSSSRRQNHSGQDSQVLQSLQAEISAHKSLPAAINCLRTQLLKISFSYGQMVSAFLVELLPILFPKCRFSLIRQVPANSELCEPERALNEGFLNKCMHTSSKKKNHHTPHIRKKSKQLLSSSSRKKII